MTESGSPPNPIPAYVGIEITRRCNLRCPHCFTESDGASPAGPAVAQLRGLFVDLVAAGVRTIAFSGGEPLLRRDLEAVMREGRAVGVESFRIVTNGALVTAARARSLREAGLTVAQVSLDGVDATDHAAARDCSPAEFYRAVRAIRLLREAGIVVDVACIINARNAGRAGEMALLCEGLGVRGLRYCSFVPTGRAREDAVRERFAVDPVAVDRFLELLRKLNAQPGKPIALFIDHGIGPWDEGGRFQCTSGHEVAYLSVEGDLYPCPGLVFPEFRVGNVWEAPVGELLRSPAMASVRRMAKGDLAGACGVCTHAACSGGCRGQAYAETGDVHGSPAYCNVRRRPRGA